MTLKPLVMPESKKVPQYRDGGLPKYQHVGAPISQIRGNLSTKIIEYSDK